LSWEQKNGKDVYTHSDDLVAVPPILVVQPGATQTIRVRYIGAWDMKQELAYRIIGMVQIQ